MIKAIHILLYIRDGYVYINLIVQDSGHCAPVCESLNSFYYYLLEKHELKKN